MKQFDLIVISICFPASKDPGNLRMKHFFRFLLTGIILLNFSCSGNDSDTETISEDLDFRQEMRNFVIGISNYAHSKDTEFLIIPQNGIELITTTGDPDSSLEYAYLEAIDANSQEDLLYGYEDDDQRTPADVQAALKALLDISKANGNTIMVVDYCWTAEKIMNSYAENKSKNYISFAVPSRELEVIPAYSKQLISENDQNINSLKDAKNFLYLLNFDLFKSKAQLIAALSETNYDVLVIDAFFEEEAFTSEEIEQLKTKRNGGKRLVLAYMSIGEAETYRYYWRNSWKNDAPEWLSRENPEWAGNYKVKYWKAEWQQIIFGNENSYLDKLILAQFDGVYLDIIDAYEYFE